ncbi:MAG: hypothetical protein ACOX0E_02655 [Syntrophomonadaceae bacterium]
MLDFRHLISMTDDIGMLQFSRKSRPDPASGYTLDDNARALMVALYMPDSDPYLFKYTNYLYLSQQKDGSWSNFMYNGKFYSRYNSEDSVGRALLACSMGMQATIPDIREMCQSMMERNLPLALNFRSPRAIAYTLVALCCQDQATVDKRKTSLIQHLYDFLKNLYQNTAGDRWYWFENYLTYCNGILPQSMFALYKATGDKTALKIGTESLGFLIDVLFQKGYLNIIGNRGWYHRGQPIPDFDQQPVDAASVVMACLQAYKVTDQKDYLKLANLADSWYRGNNRLSLSLYDEKTGGCFDALTPDGVNLNQGAEAVLSLLLSDIFLTEALGQGGRYHNSSMLANCGDPTTGTGTVIL